jgi:5-aminolevulinate synthase
MLSSALSCPFVRQNFAKLKDLKLSHAAMQCPVMGQAMYLRQMSAVATDMSPAHAPPKPIKETKQEVAFPYESFFHEQIQKKKQDKSYRYFNNINRLAKAFPTAHTQRDENLVQVWCSNDYLGMSRHPDVQLSMM